VKPYQSAGRLATAVSVAIALVMVCAFVPAVGRLWTPLLLVALALTSAFVWLAARNVRVLGAAQQRFTPGNAAAWIVLPFANVVMAHQVLTALWRESQPALKVKLGVDFSAWLVNVWWLLLAGSVAVPQLAEDFATAPGTASLMRALQRAMWTGAGVCMIAIVRGIARRQREQWMDIVRRGATPEPTASLLR
jgi:hypothetical protein